MKRSLVLIAISGLVLFGAFSVSSTSAQNTPLTSEQISLIRKNCQNVKTTLDRLHASDALLRVNRGQAYETLSTRLMEPFNNRLGNNNLDNKAMVTVAGSYRTTLDKFRNDYRLYEQKLSEAIKIDCQSRPEAFHNTLEQARDNRKKLHESVVRLHRLVDDYKLSINDFMMNYERTNR